MARITISINAEGSANDQKLITLDVPLDLSVGDFKAIIESETDIEASAQEIFLNGQRLSENGLSLEAASITDGEMLALIVSRDQRQQQRPQRQAGSSQVRGAPDAARIEQIRQQIISDPEQLNGIRQQQPPLAAAIDNPNDFRRIWENMQRIANDRHLQKDNEIRLLNEDPLNVDNQRKIEDMIRQESIQENLQYAIEHNPAAFASVTMLYVPVLVNGRPVKAFVDSGAQSTIMSPDCAQRCGISHLIDTRYRGIARGVGTANILGKVHQAKMQVGDAELDCAFTVMEGKAVELLFGLDMLRRHQACIDLFNNQLRFPHTCVEFLSEAEIPKHEEEKMLDEPTIEGPNGTEIGANSGAVRPAGTAKAAHEALQKSKAAAQPSPSAVAVSGPSGASSSAAAAGGSQSKYPESDIQKLVGLGFTRAEAIAALDRTGGNVEFAAGTMF